MSAGLKQEKTLMANQKKSVSLLKEVPCDDMFPTCRFISESHKNKGLLKEQKGLVLNLKRELDEAKSKFDLLEGEGLRQKIDRYNELTKSIQDCKMEIIVLDSKIEGEKRSIEFFQSDIRNLSDEITDLELNVDGEKTAVLAQIKKSKVRNV